MGHAHRPRTRGSPPPHSCRAAVRPDTPPTPHPHRPMPALPLHLAPPVAPPTLAVRDLEANPPRAARPIRQRRPPPATTIRTSPGSVPNAMSGTATDQARAGPMARRPQTHAIHLRAFAAKGFSYPPRTVSRSLSVVSPTTPASRCAEPARRSKHHRPATSNELAIPERTR
jgi:hypothetical protein